MNKVMVVCHPDDEIIFGGGNLLSGGWRVICLTHASNARGRKFKEISKRLGNDPYVFDFPDARGLTFDFITDILPLITDADILLTHNNLGEYGHEQHIKCHEDLKPYLTHTFSFINALPPDLVEKKCNLLYEYNGTGPSICFEHFGHMKKYYKFLGHETIIKGIA